MGNQIFEIILKTALGIAVPAAITFLTLWIKQRKERKLCVSSGLATGYYYNFIKSIFKEPKLEVTTEEGSILEFDTSTDVTVSIVVPSKLDEATVEKADRFAATGNKKGTMSRGTKRAFTIFYDDSKAKLRITDAADPINALSLYLDNLKAYKEADPDIEARYRRKQMDELNNFKKTIIRLCTKTGYGDGKINFLNEKGEAINH